MVLRSCIRGNLSPVVIGEGGVEYSDIIALLQSEGTFTRSTTGTYFDSAGVMQTAAINELRIDYDPAALESKGFYHEPQGTNIRTYSNDFKNGVYNDVSVTIQNSTDGITELSPDSTITHQITSVVAGGRLEFYPTLTDGDDWCYSHFMHAGTVSDYAIRIDPTGFVHQMDVDLVALTITNTGGGGVTLPVDSGVEDIGGGWRRVWMTVNPTGGISGRQILYVSNGTLFIFGQQVEQSSAPTSYIPTVASSVTRAADIATLPTASWFDTTTGEGTYDIEYTPQVVDNNNYVIQQYFDNSNALVMRSSAGSLNALVLSGGVLQANISGDASIAGTANKFAFAWAANDTAMVNNGTVAGTDNVYALPTDPTIIYIGNDVTGSFNVSGHIKKLHYYPSRKSNTDMQGFTS